MNPIENDGDVDGILELEDLILDQMILNNYESEITANPNPN